MVDRYQNQYILSSSKNEGSAVDFRLIKDLGLVLMAAAFGGILASLCGQPVLLGYLLGGSFIGPGGLRLIRQFVQVETMAHFGSIFLLFSVGLEFSFQKLKTAFDYALSAVACLELSFLFFFSLCVCVCVCVCIVCAFACIFVAVFWVVYV